MTFHDCPICGETAAFCVEGDAGKCDECGYFETIEEI